MSWGKVCDTLHAHRKATANLSIDHVVPRKQRGGDEAGNLVVACNSRKGGRTPTQARMALRPVPGEP